MPPRVSENVQIVRIESYQLSELAGLIARNLADMIAEKIPQRPPGWTMLPPEQAAEYLGIEAGTMRVWRNSGKGPRYIKVGGSVRYRVDALERFIKAQTRETEDSR